MPCASAPVVNARGLRDACGMNRLPFALIALGFDRLSMPPAGVGPVKRMILSCDRGAATRGILSLLSSSAGSVRGEVEALARKIAVAV